MNRRSLIKLFEAIKKIFTNDERVYYIVALFLASITILGIVAVAILQASSNPGRIGLNDSISGISDDFNTYITPADWTFSIWFIIYIWQFLWIVYGWTLAFRPTYPLTISPNSLICYSCANISLITFTHIWGNRLPQFSFGILLISAILMILAVGFEARFLYVQTPESKKRRKFKIDLYLTRILVLNGIVIYATWIIYLTLINLCVIVDFFTDNDGGNVGLSLLALFIVVYFNLENVLLDSYLRHVVIVYPVIIWCISGVINIRWYMFRYARLNIGAVILNLYVIWLFVLRIFLIIAFTLARPIQYPKKATQPLV